MNTYTLPQALAKFSAYQRAENQPKYARAVCARVAEFIDHCTEQGIVNLDDVSVRHIREWLRKTPKKTNPGAWKTRHLAVQTFFNYCVFTALTCAEDNPLAASPRGATLTNKPMLSEFDFHRMLMVIPDTHSGIQDKLICLLLWEGCTLTDINGLCVNDVAHFPDSAKQIAKRTLQHRSHAPESSLWVDVYGQKRTIHGQKFNKRLQQYAAKAELVDPSLISASLLYQSGTYHRLDFIEEEH